MKILVTGGLGYIGSHACVELMQAGHEVVVVDNLCNSKILVLARIQEITGQSLSFARVDIRNQIALESIFIRHQIDAVIHFAGLKAVGESITDPQRYYDHNVSGSLVLFQLMAKYGVKKLIFSSSATVYGDPASLPILESFPLAPTNPYGQGKWMVEQILRDLAHADPTWRIALLRYFNPVGAHESGLIGEDPNSIPNNLVPYIAQVAIGQREILHVYGGDYPTPDGTGMRDYIHVVDLAAGHVKTLDALAQRRGVLTYNLGTGRSNSVLEMVHAFEKASKRPVPYKIVGRRPGDIAVCYADASLAERELGWKAHKSIDQMCADSWRWQSSEKEFAI